MGVVIVHWKIVWFRTECPANNRTNQKTKNEEKDSSVCFYFHHSPHLILPASTSNSGEGPTTSSLTSIFRNATGLHALAFIG